MTKPTNDGCRHQHNAQELPARTARKNCPQEDGSLAGTRTGGTDGQSGCKLQAGSNLRVPCGSTHACMHACMHACVLCCRCRRRIAARTAIKSNTVLPPPFCTRHLLVYQYAGASTYPIRRLPRAPLRRRLRPLAAGDHDHDHAPAGPAGPGSPEREKLRVTGPCHRRCRCCRRRCAREE